MMIIFGALAAVLIVLIASALAACRAAGMADRHAEELLGDD